MRILYKTCFYLGLFGVLCSTAIAGPLVPLARQADDLVEYIYRQAGKNADTVMQATRRADARTIENALRQYGPEGRAVFENGGFALLRASREFGDNVVRIAAKQPEAARYVAARPQKALGVARRFGDDAVLLEKRVPGLLTRQADLLTGKEVRILKGLPADQQRRVGQLAMRAESPRVAQRIVQSYNHYGPSLIKRIPKKYLIGGGVVTAVILDRAIMEDQGITEWFKNKISEGGFWLIKWVVIAFACLFALKYAFIFAWRKLFTFRSKKPDSATFGNS